MESRFPLLSFSNMDLIEGGYNIKLRELFYFPDIPKGLID
jgi:hypothetical protein